MDVSKIRQDFAILQAAKPPVYFDNACMSLRPRQVIAAMNEYYERFPACAARSAHKLGRMATEAYERARQRIARFINARPDEMIFTKNTTEGINLVARALSFARGDVVLGTDKEHNSNLLPWLLLTKEKGIHHFPVVSNPDNTFSMKAFEQELEEHKPKLVAMVHSSNLDGVTIPAQEIVKRAHDAGALVLLDAAQSAPHRAIDVRKIGCDFLAFSGHKMLGPSGTGVLFVSRSVVEQLGQFMIGGETVINSTYDSYELEKSPARFEAGLQNYAGAIGMAAAADYLEKVGLENIHKHELELTKKLTVGISGIEGINTIGPAPEIRSSITSFNIGKVDPHSIAIMLDELANIAIRSGQHCVHSWFNAHGIKGSARASLYLYNTPEEVDTFVETLKKVAKVAK